MPRRSPGEGQIDQLPSGRFRVRLVIDGRRTSLGTFGTYEEAAAALDATREVVADGVHRVDAFALNELSHRVFRMMELDGRRGMRALRKRWDKHISPALGHRDYRRITRAEVRSLESQLRRKLGRRTTRNYLGMLAQVLDRAVEDAELTANPARLPKRARLAKHGAEEADAWTYLTLEEQHALVGCSAIPDHDRLAIAVMLGTGLRVGELVSLRLADVSVGEEPRVVVRYGSPPDGPTKTGLRRIVPLFGIALAAMRDWLEQLPTFCPKNTSGAAFPAPRGGFRSPSWLYFTKGAGAGGRTPWSRYLEAAGIARRVRVHDLRHTCAASLVSGFWGPAWQLLEVRDLLGHSSIAMTQRYAHLAPASLAATARTTRGSRGDFEAPTNDGTPGNHRGIQSRVEGWLGCLDSDPSTPTIPGTYSPPCPSRDLSAADGLLALLNDDLDTARAALSQAIGGAAVRAVELRGQPGEARALADALGELVQKLPLPSTTKARS